MKKNGIDLILEENMVEPDEAEVIKVAIKQLILEWMPEKKITITKNNQKYLSESQHAYNQGIDDFMQNIEQLFGKEGK